MHDVCLAFFWHQHQPYYPDDLGGENPMPWVRLHGTKDYWGMAKLLGETPEFHATINLAPSLVEQLLAYVELGHEDTHLRVSRLAPDELSQDDMHYLMDNFFMAHPDRMIRPFPRYHELYRKRGVAIDSAKQAAKRFSHRDILDLQVWSNLVWIHPLAFAQDNDLASLVKKERHYTQDEKLWLLARQRELLAEVVPLHRELESRGQVELTTTPFFHPILPLLWDKRLARRAMPEVPLPKHLDGYPRDVEQHLARAVAYHQRVFGRRPRGMWPSEGSVCQEIVAAVADAGIEWIATDEEILSCSTDGWVSRDAQGFLRNPEMLYRPWHVEEQGSHLQVVFRDHAMSDQIGFHYQSYDADHAVNDFLGKVEAIGRATTSNAPARPTLLSIILDGENCWEYYPNSGVDFLRKLYRRVVDHPRIRPVRIGDYLREHPATDKLGHLFPGSWIQHNFAIWIGNPQCNVAWDLLDETRQHLDRATTARTRPAEVLDRAWRELSIAEGSDWFWWFGDDHTSAQDVLFDRLFRTHLRNVYRILGDPPPAALGRAIGLTSQVGLEGQPTGLLQVKVDGRRTYFEWINAAHQACQFARGTMTMVADAPLADLYFGFEKDRLALRLDSRGEIFRRRMKENDVLKIVFHQPEGVELTLSRLDRKHPTSVLTQAGRVVAPSGVKAASDHIFETTIPLKSLRLSTDGAVEFFVQLLAEGKEPVQRVPFEGVIETTVPSPDFELVMWQV